MFGPDQQFRSETTERARSKVDVQRDKVVKLALDDPRRAAEEHLLDVLIENAQAATTANILMHE